MRRSGTQTEWKIDGAEDKRSGIRGQRGTQTKWKTRTKRKSETKWNTDGVQDEDEEKD